MQTNTMAAFLSFFSPGCHLPPSAVDQLPPRMPVTGCLQPMQRSAGSLTKRSSRCLQPGAEGAGCGADGGGAVVEVPSPD